MLVLAAFLATAGAALVAAAAPPAAPQAAVPQPTPESETAIPEVSELVVIAPKRNVEPDWSKKLNFDVQGHYAVSAKPYLRRRPANGCKAMAGGATSALGASGAAGGIVCAKRF